MTVVSRRRMLTDSVYAAVRQRLVDHDIEPGHKLNINALAQDLDVSPTPVREALARLEADGLVVKRSLAGYAAAPLLSSRDFDELFEMRILLEPAAAAHAAERISEHDLQTLTDHLATMRSAQDGSQETLRLFVDHDALFHDRIMQAGGNALIRETLLRLHAHTHLYRLYFRDGIAGETCKEHERILGALRDRDPELAAVTTRTHLRRARARLQPALTDDASPPRGPRET